MKKIIFVVVTCLSVCGGYAAVKVFDKAHNKRVSKNG